MAIAGNWLPSGNDAVRLQGLLRSSIAQLQSATTTLAAVAAVMGQMNASGTDYTTVETYFGLQAGTGHTVNDIVGSAANELSGNAFVQGILQRLG